MYEMIGLAEKAVKTAKEQDPSPDYSAENNPETASASQQIRRWMQ